MNFPADRGDAPVAPDDARPFAGYVDPSDPRMSVRTNETG